ncbi:MAG: restriction endonuclease subunit S [Candidatus Doudnabacteria bacterium]
MITYSIIQKSQLECAHRLDAEFFQPEYLELEKRLTKTNRYKKWGDIEGEFITGPFGSEFKVENYVTDGKFRYVRGKDVKSFFLMDDDNVYIPQEDFNRLKKFYLEKGDILVSVVGTLGNSAIVDTSTLPAIFSCKSTVFRSKKINPYYFIAYLNSRYGRGFLERNARGAVQTGLNIDDLRLLPLFIPPDEKQEMISSIIIEVKKGLDHSKLYYSQAENLLLEELGLKNFKPQEDLAWVVNLSEVQKAKRIDAEFFQPKYEEIISKFKTQMLKLEDLVLIKKGIEVGSEQYQEVGRPFIRVSNLTKLGIVAADAKLINDKLYQRFKNDYEPKIGEILLTKDASPGIAYVFKEAMEGIIAGGILRLKIKAKIEAEYLALVLNSTIGQMQMERDTGGSVIIHWRPEQIKNCLIPILPKSIQQKIAALIRKSHTARKKSKELLEQAKQKVEQLIEQGAQ